MRSRAALPRFATLLGLLFLPSVLSSSSRRQWVLQRVPVVLPQQTEARPTPQFLNEARLDVASPATQNATKAPRPSYWDLRSLLAYETLHHDGQLTETAIGIYGYNPYSSTSPAYSSGSSGKAERSHVRRKRQIFGHDGRFSIAGQNFLLKYPFSVAVKLSTGCSGTLVGDRHVLTAAHCVHDGKNYVKGAQRLRVGFLKPKQRDAQQSSVYLPSNFTNHIEGGPAQYPPPANDKMKFQWIRAKRTHVPKGWIKGNANDIGMDYDYALLELKKPHKRRHMKLGVSPQLRDFLVGESTSRDLTMTALDSWCIGSVGPARRHQTCCTSTVTLSPGPVALESMPGCGMAARRWERKVIGVFSGHQWVEKKGTSQEFNVAVRITPLKYAQICYWIKGNFVDCREG